MKRKTKLYLLECLILILLLSFSKNALVGYVWVLLHEVVHILVSKFYNIKINKLNLHVTGANISSNNIDYLKDNQKIILYLSGPLFNLICSIIFFVIGRYYNFNWIKICITINFALGIFNLLPSYPLDGGRILEIIINKKIIYKKAREVVVKVSFVIAAILMNLFILTIYIHKANISLLISSVLITYSTILEKRSTMYLMMGEIFRKKERLVQKQYIENKSFSMYYKSDLLEVIKVFDKNKYNIIYAVDDNFKVIDKIYEEEIIEGLKVYGSINLKELINHRNGS